ncbi:aspartate/glutamate racemase family protein [Azohydromonas caseinilytica]|uniref:Asp/Glu racemase n=1 Tax=Azohydromonas caseinilytica TaxID=2728836 RepID=A0A848FBL9_9BURK|nr:aspartate/glutamate racemase family protein [Azohydromonas caseinilytica]NML17597.1 Asp/Glu racemase [Azohydromonas caseinilytica]
MTPSLPPPRLLILNPNTSPSVTALLADHATTLLGGAAVVDSVTARLGASYIASEAACAIAGHAALDAWAAHRAAAPRPDAVLIGCFGDPGLFALRELCDSPVTGLAEASFVQAARRSARGRFAIVTGGAAWGPMLRRLAQGLGFDDALAGVHTVAPSGIQLAADPAGALPLLARACREAARDTGADCVILGGAGLAGMAARIQDQVPVPLIDSVSAGAQEALTLARTAVPPTTRAGAGDGPAWCGLSPELNACLS